MNIINSITQALGLSKVYPLGDRVLIADLSHYNDKDMTQEDMNYLYSKGVRMVIHKCSDGFQLIRPGNPMDHANYKDDQFDKRCTLAYNCKPHRMLFGAYHYFEPGNWQAGKDDPEHDFEFQVFKKAVTSGGRLKKLDVLSLDLEDHRSLNGGTETDTNISNRSRTFWEWMQKDEVLNKTKQIVYTRNSYLKDYSPSMIPWLGRQQDPFDLWCAHGAGYSNSWKWENLLYPNPEVKVPVPGWSKCIIRQYALDTLITDVGGHTHYGGGGIDLSVWTGSTQSFYDYFGVQNPGDTIITPEPTPDPLPEPPPITVLHTLRGMNVRSGPGISYPVVDSLPANTFVSPKDISVWYKISNNPEKWVCGNDATTTYIK